MRINTSRFGEIDIDPEGVIYFNDGIPGFEDEKRFALLAMEENSPFHWLQSVDNGDLAFIIANPFIFKPDYNPDIPDEEIQDLEIKDQSDIAIYSIVVVPEDYTKMTANLMSPVIINIKRKTGKQIVLSNGEYPIRYRIFPEEEKGEVSHAGTDQKKE